MPTISLRVTTVVLALPIAFFFGCPIKNQSEPAKAVVNPPNGQFSGDVHAKFLSDGRYMELLEELRFTDSRGKTWTARKGERFNGASIPKPLWSVVGGPYEGAYRDAAVIHDIACEKPPLPSTWQEVHLAFYDAMLARKVDPEKAKRFYTAVLLSGHCRWDGSGKRLPPQRSSEDLALLASLMRDGSLDVVDKLLDLGKRSEVIIPAARLKAHWSQFKRATLSNERQ